MAAPSGEELPVVALFPQLETAWRRAPVVLVKAPTGSGKSTRLPLHLLQWEGFPRDQLLLVLQPRRVAARLLARYLAGLLGERPGGTVGYQVRFERQRSERTRLLFVTEGLLLRWLAGATTLSGVGGILFDEFHERHLEGDVGLGLALRAQEAGWGGRIGILSATLETAGLRRLLPQAEVLESAGRSFPVATEFRGGLGEERPAERAVKAVRKALREGREGDYLVFLPGAGDIERAVRGIRELREGKGWEVLPLYGALAPEAQDRALRPGTGPRILVATNLAETSVTLPGIRTVIDSGLARMPAYDQRRGVNTLLVEPISRASAEQRAGRAGRVAPGTCLRLWTEADHLRRPEQTPPEIDRLDLAEMRLVLAAAGCGEDLPLPQPPPEEAWERAGRVLQELGAVDGKGITERGEAMACLPLHPRYARLLLAAEQEGCLDEMAAALAVLEAGPLRERRVDKAVERQWAEWTAAAEGFSDLLRDVLLWQKAAAADEGVGIFCRKWGLRAGAVHQASRVYRQLRGLLGKQVRPAADLPRAFARSLLTGFADHLGLRKRGTRSCLFCHGRRGEVEPDTVVDGEGLFLALDLEERAVRGEIKVRAAGLTRVEEDWLEQLFPGEAAVEETEILDTERRAVVRRRRRSFRGLLLREEESGEPDPARAAALLAEGLHRHGWPLKKWDAAAETWLRRADLLARLFPEWQLSPVREEDRLFLLEQICAEATRYKEVKDRPVLPVLRAWLPSGMEEVMDRLLPERFPLPGTRGIKLRYEADGTVVLPARIQQLYDIPGKSLTVGDGRLPLRLEILAPNQRPVHITDDLDGFWEGAYPQIRKDLFGRYPKHEWR